MPNNPNFPKAPRSRTPPHADRAGLYGDPYGQSAEEAQQAELRRMRAALEKMERRQRFSVTRVLTLLIAVPVLIIAAYLIIAGALEMLRN